MEPVPVSLAGLKVHDLSRMLPGLYCSMILADHGAEVIAIEDRRFAAAPRPSGKNCRPAMINIRSLLGAKGCIFCHAQ